MDPDPDETHLRSSTRSPREHLIDPATNATTLADRRQKELKRQSLRVRPSDILENAEPPSPLNLSAASTPVPQATSKMSLFSLFSRPKAERARGHAGEGPTVPQSQPRLVSSASTPNLLMQSRSQNASIPPTPSIVSAKTTAPPASKTSKSKAKEAAQIQLREQERDQKHGSFNPPPLFQAFPQSMKDGILEVANMSLETVLHKSKSKKSAAIQVPGGVVTSDSGTENTVLTEGKRSAMLKHVTHGTVAHVDLPKKVFVLVTSGYLLQYPGSGSSERLPEKVLHLGKDSAAFACDLVPGKHYVLQVSQAVDQDGVIIANSGSIFSKLGIRSSAAKRATSHFLLVMPNAEEMESWMTAIRKEIEHRGGKKIRPDTTVRPMKTDPSNDPELKKTPSHRYQVKRNPSKVSSVISHTVEPAPPMTPKRSDDKSDAETATIDGIEMEASKLDDNDIEPAARRRAESDAPSISSSAAISVEQQQINSLRPSLSTSTHMSRASQAPTIATTAANSRANSVNGSPPPSERSLAASLDATQETNVAPKSGYRSLLSYNSSRRRSAQPLPITREIPTPPAPSVSPPRTKPSVIDELPIGSSTPPSAKAPSPPKQKRLTNAFSEPNFHSLFENDDKHDSKIATPPPVDADGERPESFVGDLPPPSTWTSSRASNRRTSTIQPVVQQTPLISETVAPPQATARTPEQTKAKRMSSFSMPLKVNPSGPNARATSGNNRRMSRMNEPDPAGDTPVVHTLTAKADPSNRLSILQMQSSTPSPILDVPQRSPSLTPSPRLSLFPIPLPSPSGGPPEPPRRSSSAMATMAQPLKRPTSMQVSSDRAPFLSSARNSTGPMPAAPIRGMKPSRSATNVAALARPPSTNAFRDLNFNTPPSLSEEADKATPLVDRAISPMPKSSSSAGRRKSLRPRSSLPELDLGLPVVGLGPPAPPPSAPLPPPPPASRTTSPSPTPPSEGAGGIDSIVGLGIRVS